MTDLAVALDDRESYRTLDPSDMYRRVDELAEQIEDARALAADFQLPTDFSSAKAVIIAGMGGSAIGGSLLEAYGAGEVPVPVSVWRNYDLPAWVAADTLVIAVSYSGNTEETLSALQEAHGRGCKLMVITSGGKMESLAREWGIPCFTFHYEAQPRAVLGYLFTPLVLVFEQLGFLSRQAEAVEEAVRIVRSVQREWGANCPTRENLAKQMASSVQDKGIVIYGADYLAAVARRWKTQMNENAKTWAFYEEFPELNHNAVVGYEYHGSFIDSLQVVMLSGSHLPERLKIRMQVTRELLQRHGIEPRVAEAGGSSRLAQMFSLIALGDYVSYYLALLNGADPTTIGPIDFLKAALARA